MLSGFNEIESIPSLIKKEANSGQKNDPEASAFYLSPNAMHMITFKIYEKKP